MKYTISLLTTISLLAWVTNLPALIVAMYLEQTLWAIFFALGTIINFYIWIEQICGKYDK